MKKALLITLYDNNYGNKLQNYALQEILKNQSIESYTLKIEEEKDDLKYILQNIIYKIIPSYVVSKWPKAYRRLKFACFSEKYLNTISIEDFNKTNIKFNYAFFGSDQIWNLTFKTVRDNYFYFFGDIFDLNKIAVSPSIGVDFIPDEFQNSVRKSLENFVALSVRENAGQKALCKISNSLISQVLIDPTLATPSDKWYALTQDRIESDSYVLTYFLGEVPKYVKIFINNNFKNHKLVNIADISSPKNYGLDPFEFLNYIRYSDIVLTDSFHACIFSVIFKKNFLVTPRDGDGAGMGSRINELLKRYNLEKHMFFEGCNPLYRLDNYNHISEIMEKDRKIFNEYLSKAINKCNS